MKLKSVTVKKEEKISQIALNEGISYVAFKKILRKKDVKVNGVRTNKDVEVKRGDKVEFYYVEAVENIVEVYKDENVLVCDKRQGIESRDFYDEVKKVYPSAIFTHRLDRNTGGLMIFALNDRAYRELYKALRDRTIEKYYLALVWGVPPKKEDEITAYCKKDVAKSQVYVYPENGKGRLKMVTGYKLLKTDEIISLLEVKLITGRTHQIRSHLSFIGNFILGDGKYGKEEINKRYRYKYQQLFAYRVIFHFESGSFLGYLNGKEIKIEKNIF